MLRVGAAFIVLVGCVAAAPARPAGGVIRVGGLPVELLAGNRSLWVLTCDQGCTGEGRQAVGRILRIDPRRQRVSGSMPLPRPGLAAASRAGVYVTDFWRDTVRRLDARRLRMTGALKLRLPFRFSPRDNAFLPEAIAAGTGSVWVATDRGALARADPALRRVISTKRLQPEALGDPIGALAVGEGSVWLAESLAGVYRLDPRTGRTVARIRIPLRKGRFDATEVVPCGGKVLVLGARTSAGALTVHYLLARLSPRSDRIDGVMALGHGPFELACGSGSLWLGRQGGTTLERLEPATGRLVERKTGRIGEGLAFAGSRLWTVLRDGTVRQL